MWLKLYMTKTVSRQFTSACVHTVGDTISMPTELQERITLVFARSGKEICKVGVFVLSWSGWRSE